MATLEPPSSHANPSLDKAHVENTEDIETGRSSSVKHNDDAHIERVELTESDVGVPLRRQPYPAYCRLLTPVIETEQEDSTQDRHSDLEHSCLGLLLAGRAS